MASTSTKIKFKPRPTDIWSTREKLALASAVLKSGDQNWVSVSRTVRPFGEFNRPQEWFIPKNCALQYSELLEKWEIPKRKRAERTDTETPGSYIVKRLSVDRTEELKRLIQEKQERFKILKQEIELVKSGAQDDKLTTIWNEMCEQKAAAAAAQTQAIAKFADELKKLVPKPVVQAKLNRPVPGLKLKIGETPVVEELKQEPVTETIIKVEDDSVDVEIMPEPKQEVVVTSLPVASSEPIIVPEQQVPESSATIEVQANTHGAAAEPMLIPPIKKEPEEIKIEPIEVKEVVVTTDDAKQQVVTGQKTPPAAAAPVAIPVTIKESSSPVTTSVPTLSRLLVTPPISSPGSSLLQSSLATNEKKTSAPPSQKTPVEPAPVSQTLLVPKTEPSPDVQEKPVEPTTPVTPTKSTLAPLIEEDPVSPASSIVSNENEGIIRFGAAKGRTRGTKGRRGKAKGRPPKSQLIDESFKGSDTSDDERESDQDTAHKLSLSMTESIPNSPASFCQSDTEDEKNYKAWKKSIMLVWRAAANHKFANVFLHPVTDDIAPGYSIVVLRPMDLTTIKKHIESGVVRTTERFQRDMMLMFTNALMYNNSDQDIYSMAVEMYRDVMVHIEQFVNAQLMVSAETKVLRTSRRSDISSCGAASDKEEESKKRKGSSEQTESSVKKKR